MITELRRYRIVPERLDSWLTFFAGAVDEHVRRGMRVEYVGVDRETSTFIWLRSFPDEPERVDQKAGFYGSDWWLEREAFAMSHVLSYDVTFLEATAILGGGTIEAVPLDDTGERGGSRGDSPPDGWETSPRRLFTRAIPG
jgi:hypothetical protein